MPVLPLFNIFVTKNAGYRSVPAGTGLNAKKCWHKLYLYHKPSLENYTIGIKKSIKFAQSSNFRSHCQIFTTMDALSKVLETIKFKGVVYDRRELSAPWGIEV